MRDLLKSLYFGIIKLFQTIVSLLLVLFFNRNSTARELKRQRIDRNGRGASLIANGPSAREIINDRAALLDNTDLIVLNTFGNQEVFSRLKPKYYILLDPSFFDSEYINKGLNENSISNNKSEFDKLKDNFNKVDWKMTLLLPATYAGRRAKRLYGNNPCIDVLLYNYTRVLGFDWFQNLMYHKGAGLPSSRNVVIPAMLLLILLGYKTIYLYGCEISWTKTMDVDPENGQMFFNDRHFYSKDEIRYFGKGAYLWWLEAISEMLRGVEQVAKFAQSRNVRIINRTKGSFIDAFEYENPDNIK